jgi:hypothetical protein
MTHRAVGFGRGFPRTWLFPIGALTILLGVAATGRLSRAIAADLIAWWPVWLGLGISAFLLRDRKLGSLRVAGLVPLVALVFIGLFTWGHLAGWSIMPSASQRLVGPDPGTVAEATLDAAIDGRIELRAGSDFLYQVEPIRRGGPIGIPAANEHVAGSTVAIQLEAPDDPGLYSYAGWEIAVATGPRWDLRLDGALDVDLTGLVVSTATVGGSGTVTLGDPGGEAQLSVDGDIRIVLPGDVPARVNGVASVPATWTPDSEGAMAPPVGVGWVITVVGDSSVAVVDGS